MNDWDKMFKDVSCYEDNEDEEPQADWLEVYELPEGFKKVMFSGDDYACYAKDAEGRIYLAKVDPEDERSSYTIHDGCVGLFENAIRDQHSLAELIIPRSVVEIPDGALSNAGSWAETENGLISVKIDEENPRYMEDGSGVYEKLENGRKLICCLENTDAAGGELVLEKDVISIGKNALFGRRINRVIFKSTGVSVSFPKHAYFREELLKSFGINGKAYDFTEYDSFLLRNHFNSERIRMICERLSLNSDISDEMRNRLFDHIYVNMREALEALSKEEASDEIRSMLEAGFFDKDNIDMAIDTLNHTDSKELMTYLMDYKNEKLGKSEFDFSV